MRKNIFTERLIAGLLALVLGASARADITITMDPNGNVSSSGGITFTYHGVQTDNSGLGTTAPQYTTSGFGGNLANGGEVWIYSDAGHTTPVAVINIFDSGASYFYFYTQNFPTRYSNSSLDVDLTETSLGGGVLGVDYTPASGGVGDISGAGSINYTFQVSAVPEPVNGALALFGIIAVGGSAGRFYLGRRRLATAG